jgi:hypothetical protein
MRFIVEVFRVLVLVLLALLLVGAAFVGFTLAIGGFRIETGLAWPVVAGIFAAMVVGLGLVGTFIAIHDRLAEMALGLQRVADNLELPGTQSEDDPPR